MTEGKKWAEQRSWPDLQHTEGVLGNTENTESHFGEKEDNSVEEMGDMDFSQA